MARFKEQSHPFYKPLWVRLVIVAVVAFWLVFEYVQSSASLWTMVAAGFLAYSIYMFFITWPKAEDTKNADAKNDGPEDDAPPPA